LWGVRKQRFVPACCLGSAAAEDCKWYWQQSASDMGFRGQNIDGLVGGPVVSRREPRPQGPYDPETDPLRPTLTARCRSQGRSFDASSIGWKSDRAVAAATRFRKVDTALRALPFETQETLRLAFEQPRRRAGEVLAAFGAITELVLASRRLGAAYLDAKERTGLEVFLVHVVGAKDMTVTTRGADFREWTGSLKDCLQREAEEALGAALTSYEAAAGIYKAPAVRKSRKLPDTSIPFEFFGDDA